jgi:hypothetical protein
VGRDDPPASPPTTESLLRRTNFALLVLALAAGALIILRALWSGRRGHVTPHAALEEAGVPD